MSNKIKWSEDQQKALDCFYNTKDNMFITGKAGSGKTLLLKEIVENSKNCVVSAPTGVAALNAGGVTLHSFLHLPIAPYKPMFMRGKTVSMLPKYSLSPEKISVIEKMKTLIIDEISMVRADLLDAVNDALCYYRENKEPFGGVRVIFVGDLFQLPPVVKKDDWNMVSRYYETPYFFSAQILKYTKLNTFHLEKVFRQKDDKFIDVLNKIRYGENNPKVIETINKLHKPKFSATDEGWVTLTSTNQEAKAINNKMVKDLDGESYQYEAKIKGAFNTKEAICEINLELKEGAQIMMLVNDNQEHKYVNGSIGTFLGEFVDESGEKLLVVDIDDETCLIPKATWNKMEYKSSGDMIVGEPIGSCAQYPVKLAWAITIHKSQGLTFDKVAIDAKRAFAHGQVYVALSRGTSMEGTVLLNKVKPYNIKCDRVLLDKISNLIN